MEQSIGLRHRENNIMSCSNFDQKMEPLGIIFDIDGTLIAEGDTIQGIIPRPGAVEFLAWCKMRGHSLAIWTAAGKGWAEFVAKNLCKAVMNATYNNNDESQNQHNITCKRLDYMLTFDFIWSSEKLHTQELIYRQRNCDSVIVGCQWCSFYSSHCKRCCCFSGGGISYCPCRYVKALKKIWKSKDDMLSNFKNKRRTLIVENTPQQCIFNYGNAIYFPTYNGKRNEESLILFQRFKNFILELETVDDVRAVQKCFHRKGPHACFEQNWWSRPLLESGLGERENKKNKFSEDLDSIV